MSRKFLTLTALLVLMLGAVSLVSAQSDLPGTGWLSGQQVQNIGNSNATVALTAYDDSGNDFPCGSQSLAPGESYTFLTDTDCATLAPGFQGSAVVSADQKVAAVVNVVNKPGGGPAAGQYTGTDGSDVSTTINFPLVKSNHSGRTTTFYLQNASVNPNNLTATFRVNGTSYPINFNNVPANAMVVVTPQDAGVPTGTGNVGSLQVVGTQPVAGTSLEHQTSIAVAENLQGSRAFTPSDYDTTLYCPLLRNRFGGKKVVSGLQVQNVGASTQTVQVTYTIVTGPSGAGTVIGPVSQSVAPGESANFLQENDLLEGDLASGTITTVSGSGQLAAVVNEKALLSTPQRVTTYACFGGSSATSVVSLPQVKEDFGGSTTNTTGVQVQNVGNAATTVTLTYSYATISGGSGVVEFTHSDSLAPGQSKTFYRVANGGTSNLNILSGTLAELSGSNSGVQIVSNNGQPIVAMANEASLSGNLQDTKNYEGFNLVP